MGDGPQLHFVDWRNIMEPTKKSAEITKLLDEMSDRTISITNDKCVRPPIGCGKPIGEFRDEISKREYTISGLCQACQDEIFGEK